MMAAEKLHRTALLIRCTVEEAEMIRQAAERERRTISGYVLNAMMQRIAVKTKTEQHFQEVFGRPLSKGKPPNDKAKSKARKQAAGEGQE